MILAMSTQTPKPANTALDMGGGINRGRYTVHLGGVWQLYINHLPSGWTAHCVIDRGGEKGALVESPAGTSYVKQMLALSDR